MPSVGIGFVTAERTQSVRSFPDPDAERAASAPEWTHLHETVISTLVAGMLPLMGSKSRTVAVASTLSMTSPSMRARDPGQHSGQRESLWTCGADRGEQERSGNGPDEPPRCCPSDTQQHGKFTDRLWRRGGVSEQTGTIEQNASAPTPPFSGQRMSPLPQEHLKSKSCELHPSCLHSPTCGAATGTRCRVKLLICGWMDHHFAPNSL